LLLIHLKFLFIFQTKVMTLLKRKAESNEHASKLMKKING